MTIAKINNIAIANIKKINKKVSKDYVKLLIQFNGIDGANTYTAETGQTVTFVGTAQLDTDQKKFGTASLLLDGNSDYVTVPDSDDWTFGAEDFTIDCYVRFNNLTGRQYICSQFFDGEHYIYFAKLIDNKLRFYYGGNTTALAWYETTDIVSLNTNNFFHIAFVRNGTGFYIFVNGISKQLTAVVNIGMSSLDNINSTFNIGQVNSIGWLNGWIDGVRISKGIARWTDDFNVSDVAPGLIDIAKVNNIAI